MPQLCMIRNKCMPFHMSSASVRDLVPAWPKRNHNNELSFRARANRSADTDSDDDDVASKRARDDSEEKKKKKVAFQSRP